MSGYNFATVAMSIMIDGVDTRARFQFECDGGVSGRNALQLRRVELSAPNQDGTKVSSRTYDPVRITISGWIPKSLVAEFRQFLSDFSVGDQPRTSIRHWIQFSDDPGVRYEFDAVESFDTNPLGPARFWREADDVGITFVIGVVASRPVAQTSLDGMALGDSGRYGGEIGHDAYGGTSFIMGGVGPGWEDVAVKGARGAVIKIGKTTGARRFGSATHALVTEFNRGPVAKNVFGDDVQVERWACSELLTNADLEAGKSSGWTAAGTAVVREYNGIYDELLAIQQRVSSGQMTLRVYAAAVNDGIYQDFAVTSGHEYRVIAELYAPYSRNVRVIIRNPGTGDFISYLIAPSSVGELVCFETTFVANFTGSARLLFEIPGGADFFFLCRASACDMGVTNYGFDGGFTGGVANGWTAAGAGTFAQGTARIASAGIGNRYSQKITSTGGVARITYFPTPATLSLYRVSGWVKVETAAAGYVDLKCVNNNSGGNSKATLNASWRVPDGGEWVQFTTYFHTLDEIGGPFLMDIAFEFDGTSGDVIYLDDVSVTRLYEKTTGQYFEGGRFGNRLQIPAGEAALISASAPMNAISFAAFARYLRTWDGCRMVAQMASGPHDGFSLHDSGLLGFNAIVDAAAAASHDSVNESSYDASLVDLEQFRSGPGGCEGVGFQWDGDQNGAVRITSERSQWIVDGSRISADSAAAIKSGVGPSAYQAAGPTRVVLGDVGYFDAFWIFNHALTRSRFVQEMSSLAPPEFLNRIASYGVSIGAGDFLIIDSDRGSAKLWDDSANAFVSPWANLEGDLPEFLGEIPVLVVSSSPAAGVQFIARAVS